MQKMVLVGTCSEKEGVGRGTDEKTSHSGGLA